nr:hypothetical protein [Salmonella enterica]
MRKTPIPAAPPSAAARWSPLTLTRWADAHTLRQQYLHRRHHHQRRHAGRQQR